MPYLGDYIGHLLSEITNARAQADLETLRLAELYASDPLLKNMPVPRFRLPNIELDVPVAISNIEEAKDEKTASKTVYTKNQALSYIRKGFDKTLTSHLEQTGIKLTTEEQSRLNKVVNETFLEVKQTEEGTIRATFISDRITDKVTKAIAEFPSATKVERETLQKMSDDLRTAIQKELTKYLSGPTRVNALVTTAELREAGPIELLARLHFTISEQSVEWSAIEGTDKTTKHTLVPE